MSKRNNETEKLTVSISGPMCGKTTFLIPTTWETQGGVQIKKFKQTKKILSLLEEDNYKGKIGDYLSSEYEKVKDNVSGLVSLSTNMLFAACMSDIESCPKYIQGYLYGLWINFDNMIMDNPCPLSKRYAKMMHGATRKALLHGSEDFSC